MAKKIKPCPFCASKAKIFHKQPLTDEDCVSCTDEDCVLNQWNGLYITLEKWNTRKTK
jgi:hypothetical protein